MRGFCEDLFQTVARISRGLHRQGRSALQFGARDASWRELRPADASDKRMSWNMSWGCQACNRPSILESHADETAVGKKNRQSIPQIA